MKLTKTRLVTGIVVISSLATGGAYWYHRQQEAEQAAMLNMHGHGKKALSCDMSKLVIRHKGTDKILQVKEFINQNAEGLIHEKARKMFRYKVQQMTQLLEDYPDSQSVTFVSCDDDETLIVAVDKILEDPFNYVLSLNNQNRARLATYTLTNKRARYHTEVKNIIRIEIN